MRAAIFNEPQRDRAPVTGPTLSSSSPPTRSSASCSPASAARTSGTTAATRRSSPGPIGHEFVGVVEDVGADVAQRHAGRPRHRAVRLQRRHLPALPARHHDRLRERRVLPRHERRRRPGRGRPRSARRRHARVTVPGSGHSDEMLRSLLTLSDVMGTGHHAAVCADVHAGTAPSRSSATAPSASPVCSPPSGWAPSGSSR